jgi:polyhydroxyalkanoate synthase
MHSFYLRKMYQENLLAKPGGITRGSDRSAQGQDTGLSAVDARGSHRAVAVDLCRDATLSARSSSCSQRPATSPGSSTRRAANTVIGSEENPPTPDEWLAGATQRTDSWWPLWEKWVAKYAGGTVPARLPGDGKLTPIEDAPGSYVKIRGEE